MDEKGKGIIAYVFGWVGSLIVLLAFKDNTKKTLVHVAQSFLLSIILIGGGIVLGVFSFVGLRIVEALLQYALYICCFVLWIMGIVKVAQNDVDPELPVIGKWATSMFAGMIAKGVDNEQTTNQSQTYANQNTQTGPAPENKTSEKPAEEPAKDNTDNKSEK